MNRRAGKLRAAGGICAAVAIAALPSAAGAATAAPLPVPAISSFPAMTPTFDPAVLDYSVTCPDETVRLTAKSPNGVSVGWGSARTRAGSTLVNTKLTPGKRTTFVVEHRTRGRLVKRTTYSVRCRPADLPVLAAAASGKPTVDWILMVPRPIPFLNLNNYIVIYDKRGTPVWWYRTETNATEVQQVDSTSIVHFDELQPDPFQGGSFGRWIVRGLDGKVKATIQPPGVLLDQHDIARTSSGSWLTIAYERRDGVNLRSLGGSSNSTVFDGVIREVSPANQVLWTWNSATRTTPGVTGGLERPIPLRDGSGGEAYDLVHANSVFANGSDSAIISLRAYDVVLNVSRKTGETLWQLGGRSTPERLTVVGDPESRPLVGQHDARLLPDGTLTMFDNGTTKDGFVRAPRAVRYRIDPAAKTATFISQITDPAAPKSPICGSYRVLPNGNALIDWGGTRRITETAPDGTVLLALTLPMNQALAYRAVPVSESSISRSSLQSAMDRSLGGKPPAAG